jgi:hypothetical protein
MNSFLPIHPSLIDAPSPEIATSPDGQSGLIEDGGDTPDALWDACGNASRRMPDALRVPQRDWAERARENDRNGTWPVNFIDRYTNQSPSHECVYHSLTRAMEGARNRQRGFIFFEGPKKSYRYEESAKAGSVWLSPLSGYSLANPRQWGGANVRQSVERACRDGLLPDKIQPRDYGFKHQLQGTSGKGCNNQSGGGWIAERNFPEGWKETAKHFRAIEVIFPESWEDAVSLVLNGMFVCVGRNGHAIPWGLWNHTEQAMGYPDSYEVTRYDSLRTVKSAWQGSFAIASMTVPDDWSRPAG